MQLTPRRASPDREECFTLPDRIPRCRDGIGWKDPSVPKRHWVCDFVEDLDKECHTCTMCGYEKVRYVHHMVHTYYPTPMLTGWVCAGFMEGSLQHSRRRHVDMMNRAARRLRWNSHIGWRRGREGRKFIFHNGEIFLVSHLRPGEWSVSHLMRGRNEYDEIGKFADQEVAITAAFHYRWPKKIEVVNGRTVGCDEFAYEIPVSVRREIEECDEDSIEDLLEPLDDSVRRKA